MRTIAVLVAAMLLAAGCGGAEAEAPAPVTPADERKAAEAAVSYFDELAARSFGDACELLSDGVRTRLYERTQHEDCGAVLRAGFEQAPEEVMRSIGGVKALSTRAEGARVEVELLASGKYATRAKRVVVPMERGGIGWVIAELPSDTTEDPVTTCFAGGMSAFEAGEAGAYWRREGRKDFAAYLVRVCREVIRRGYGDGKPVPPPELEAARRKVVSAMVRSGRLARP